MKQVERRAWRLFLVSATAVAGSCLAYKLYNSKYVVEKRCKLEKFLQSLSALSDALSSTSDISATICRDLQQYLHSSSTEVPRSVRQLLKLSRCAEFQGAVSQFSEGVMSGVVRAISGAGLDLQVPVPAERGGEVVSNLENRLGAASEFRQDAPGNGGGIPERILDKLFSDAGRGFVSVVVGKAVRSLVHSYFDCANEMARRSPREAENPQEEPQQAGVSNSRRGWDQILLELAGTPRGKALVTLIVSSFASNVVSTFLESTDGVNVCEELVASMTKAPYKEPVTDLLRNVASGAVDSLVRTSHEVFSTDRAGPSARARDSEQDEADSSIQPRNLFPSGNDGDPDYRPDDRPAAESVGDFPQDRLEGLLPPSPSARRRHQGLLTNGRSDALLATDWQSEVQKLLAAPETRQLVVDVAGTMSAQGIRTCGSLLMETFTQQNGAVGGARHSTFSLRGVASKAMTASSVCLALCMHMMIGTRIGNL